MIREFVIRLVHKHVYFYNLEYRHASKMIYSLLSLSSSKRSTALGKYLTIVSLSSIVIRSWSPRPTKNRKTLRIKTGCTFLSPHVKYLETFHHYILKKTNGIISTSKRLIFTLIFPQNFQNWNRVLDPGLHYPHTSQGM